MRRGFTLIELLIVLFIIAVLLGLMCPAVSKVRHAAALQSCRNNLKQLGLALHDYRAAHGHFPPGTLPNPTTPPDSRLSFHVALLPYLEQHKLYDAFDRDAAWDAAKNADAGKRLQVRALHCPGYWGPQPAVLHTNYVGVTGVGAGAVARPLGDPGVGLFGHDRKPKVEDVADGTANTLALLETGFRVGPAVRGGAATIRPIDPLDEPPLVGEGRSFGGLHREDRTFGGTRPLGVQALMADGAVRLSAPEVEMWVLGALATIAGREPVPADW